MSPPDGRTPGREAVGDASASESLYAELCGVRESVLGKLDGLSDYDIRRPLTPSGTNLLGLVKHLATWEARYLGSVFGRPFPEPLPRWDDESEAGSDLWVREDETRDEIIGFYRRVWDHSERMVDALDIEAAGFVPWWPQPEVKLFNVLVHLLGETSRHAGHMDILREQLDATSLGPPIGSGRSADIYDCGDGRVLRRRRVGPVSQAELEVMEAVREAGFPVPEVYKVDGCDMVMDRIDGEDLLSVITKRPWKAKRVGIMLGDLHRKLAAVPLDDTDLPTQIEPREGFIHGDLHPGNVLLSSDGPVVIDWEGAGVGASDADVATTWLLLVTAEPDDVPLLVRPLVGAIRRIVLRAFLSRVEAPRSETVAAVCRHRLSDSNMTPLELERIQAFALAHGT